MAKRINLENGGITTIYKKEEQERIAKKLNFTLQSFQELFMMDNSDSYPSEQVFFVTSGSRYKEYYNGYLFDASSLEWIPALCYREDVPEQIKKKFKVIVRR